MFVDDGITYVGILPLNRRSNHVFKSSWLNYDNFELNVYDDINSFTKYHKKNTPPRDMIYNPKYIVYDAVPDLYGYCEIINSHLASNIDDSHIGNILPREFFMDIDDDSLVPSNVSIYKRLKMSGLLDWFEAAKYVILYKEPIWEETTDYYFRATMDEYYDYLTYTYDLACSQYRKFIKRALCRRMSFEQIYN